MFSEDDLTALFITFKLAIVTTLILLLIGIPLAWWLARTKWRFKFLLEAIIALPLVLPPTVLGFYLLLALGPNGAVGGFMQFLGAEPLAFTFTGLIIGSVVYSMPFVVQPLQNAFAELNTSLIESAATLRASPIDCFFSVALPIARPGILTASALGFSHTLGEFGIVLMIGGNIPGETKVASIAIYDHVESLNYINAHMLSLLLLIISFVLLAVVYAVNRRYQIMRL